MHLGVTWLHRYAQLLVCATLLLVAAGGMVTSTSSGLSVPDWPTTYGRQMFAYPLKDMNGGIFYEHGHRLIASTVGFLTIGLVVFTWRVDRRAWMRKLTLTALGVVILQGVLGGLTVLFRLPPAISIAHAGLAQLFFCLTLASAWGTGPGKRASDLELTVSRPRKTVNSRSALRFGLTAGVVAAVYAQILLGATMRHLGAGLAIPDFPLAFGGLLPPAWPLPVAIHFAHRAGAVVVTTLVLIAAIHVMRQSPADRALYRNAVLLILAVAAQVTLGASVVLTLRDPIVNTLHVATGALVLGTALVLALRVREAARSAMRA